jgi:hypothetical protein
LDTSFNSAIDAAIAVATVMVDEILVGEGLSANTLKNSELYLASHFATLSAEKGPLAAVSVGEATERYHDIYKEGLNATRFGQQAMVIDPTGKLSAASARATKPMLQALFTVVGTPTEDEEA